LFMFVSINVETNSSDLDLGSKACIYLNLKFKDCLSLFEDQ